MHDLFDLLLLQLEAPALWDGRVYNVGGGNDVSVSLQELTELCVQETGKTVPIASVPETAGVDLRIYMTDARKAAIDFGWRPDARPRSDRPRYPQLDRRASRSLESLLT